MWPKTEKTAMFLIKQSQGAPPVEADMTIDDKSHAYHLFLLILTPLGCSLNNSIQHLPSSPELCTALDHCAEGPATAS